MNIVTKNRIIFLIQSSDLHTKDKVQENNKSFFRCSVHITGLYRTTYSRYKDFIKETLNKSYGTYTHVLGKDIEYNQIEENVCVVEFILIPPGINA